MAQQNINRGSYQDDPSADSAWAASGKMNANFTELYTALGLGSNWKFFVIQGEGPVTPEEVSDFVNGGATIAVGMGRKPLYIRVSRTSTSEGISKYYIFDFSAGAGFWGGGTGETWQDVTANMFRLLSVISVTPDDIINDPGTDTITLGYLEDGDFITALNVNFYDWSDARTETAPEGVTTYIAAYIIDNPENPESEEERITVYALFNGTPGEYGFGAEPFVSEMFVDDYTNSEASAAPGLQDVLTVNNRSDKTIRLRSGGHDETRYTPTGIERVLEMFKTAFRFINPTKNNVIEVPDKSGLIALVEDIPELNDRMYVMKYPDNFLYRPFNVIRGKNTEWSISTAPFESNFSRDFTGVTPYYISPSGSDSNDGLTSATPKLTIASAYSAGGRLFLLSEGRHKRTVLNGVATDGSNIAIIGVGKGKTYITGLNTIASWATYNDIYNSTFSSVTQRIIDYKYVNEYGYPLCPQRLNTIVEVENTPNSWCKIGSVIYLRTIDDRIPDTDIEACALLTSSTTIIDAPGGNVYIKDISFISRGGAGDLELGSGNFTIDGTGVSPDVKVYAKNCDFLYGQTEGFRINNVLETYLENCTAFGNYGDGFNYKTSLLSDFYVVEYNCNSVRNSYYDNRTIDNVNGSSSHNGGTILRINGVYAENFGPNIIDVDAGTSTICVGTVSKTSRGLIIPGDPNGGNLDYGIGNDDGSSTPSAFMTLIDTYSGHSDVSFLARDSGKMTVINSIYSVPFSGNVVFITDLDSSVSDNVNTLNDAIFPVL